MSDGASEEIVTDDTLVVPEEKKKKGQKPKKRPSDFEITRTILQRTCERKLPNLIKNMGEDSDIFLLCSEKEDGFTFGSSNLAIALVEFDDPELRAIVDGVMSKLYGMDTKQQILINLRDQISELSKTKGESFDVDITTNEQGSSWSEKQDIRGQTRTMYYSMAIDSLYHFQAVTEWNRLYRDLLGTSDPKHLYHPYVHPDGVTYTMLTVPPHEDKEHPISQLFPNGFRTMVTRGIDLLITKMFEPHFPYPVEKEELIFFIADGATCQMAHRVIGKGWRMILVRPNAFFIPTADTPLPNLGPHVL